jgi:hypothetical protein
MLNGHNKEKDFESRERMIMMRNLMWAVLMPTQKRGFKVTDVMQFDFEKQTLKQMSLTEYAEFENEIEQVKAYYAKLDPKC